MFFTSSKLIGTKRINALFKNAKDAKKSVFVPYIMNNYPDSTTFLKALDICINNENTILEIGIPYSDPVMDGATLQDASKIALSKGGGIKSTLRAVKDVRGKSLQNSKKTPIILMLYYNNIYCYGTEKFIKDSLRAGVDGFIIPDLSLETSVAFEKLCKKNSLALIRMISPLTDSQRIEKIVSSSEGFIYYISLLGITGAKQADIKSLESKVHQVLKRSNNIPVVVGFGIKTPEYAKEITNFADGFVVGSHLVQCLTNKGAGDIDSFKKAIDSFTF